MRPLRFCMVTTFYPPYNFGGDGVEVQRLSHALARRGHHVTVIHDVDAYDALSRGRRPAPTGPEPSGVDVVRLRSRLGALSPLLTQQLGRPVANGRTIRRLLDAGRFDVIHYHNVSLVGGPGILAEGDAIKLYSAHEHWLVCPMHVLWRHGRELCTGRQCLRCTLRHRRPPQLWRHTGLLARRSAHVDAFIAKSEFSRRKHREFGFTREMEVVPPFLPDAPEAPDAAADPPPHDRPYFLFVGRLEPIKGLDDVVPLFSHYRDADLLVIGDGGHGAALRRAAAGLPVHFLGRVDGAELDRYYRHAIALVVPSRCYETFGMVLIEAFRQGTPVVARRIGPFPEIVEAARGGELFDDAAGLRAALERLGADPRHRERLGRAAREAFRRRWTEKAVLPRYFELVRRAAEARGRSDIAEAARGPSVPAS